MENFYEMFNMLSRLAGFTNDTFCFFFEWMIDKLLVLISTIFFSGNHVKKISTIFTPCIQQNERLHISGKIHVILEIQQVALILTKVIYACKHMVHITYLYISELIMWK